MDEDSEAVDEDNSREEEQREPRQIGLPGQFDPGYEARDGGEVVEPEEDYVRGGGDAHVGEEADGRCDADAVVGDSSALR